MLTKKMNYQAFYKFWYKKDATDEELKKLVPKLASSTEFAAKAAVWYLNTLKVQKYINDDTVDRVIALINYPKALETGNYAPIHGMPERKKFFNLLKEILNYEECK